MAVFVGVPVYAANVKCDPRSLSRVIATDFKLFLDFLKRSFPSKGEIKVFRKSIIGDIAFLESSSPFEGQDIIRGVLDKPTRNQDRQ